MSSSASDTTVYRSFCAEAARTDSVFASFRRAPVYTAILEHVSCGQGAQYLTAIAAAAPDFLVSPFLDAARLNDSAGDPGLCAYAGLGSISPTTLRYLKVAADLRGFDLPENGTVYEVGGGYGGQARIFKLLWPKWQYVIIDLPEVLALARRFLTALDVSGVAFLSMEEALAGLHIGGDLFISNYALTECAPVVHRGYIKQVALSCARGYVTGNALEAETLGLLAPVQPQRLPEEPRTGAANFIARWDQANKNG